MTDNRFSAYPTDARFPSPGVDARFPGGGVDHGQTRWTGDSYGDAEEGPENLTDPAISAIAANGWTATYGTPPAEFDYVADPRYLSVDSPGFDANGDATTLRRQLLVTKRVRQPYPAEASLTANGAALADYVYQGDEVVENGTTITNNSTGAYPKPIPCWLHEDRRICDGTTVTLRLTVAHAYAQQGRPVAAVKFILNDGAGHVVEEIVSDMVAVHYSIHNVYVSAYEAVLSLATLNTGAVTCDAIIYPWVGDAFQGSVDGTPAPTSRFGTQVIINNRSLARPRVYAYVNGVGAGTPAVSTNRATALTTGYASINNAMAGIAAYNLANHGVSQVDYGVVVVAAGTWDIGDQSSRVTTVAGVTIEAETEGQQSSHVLRSAETDSDSLPDHLRVRHCRCEIIATGNTFAWANGATAAGSPHTMTFEACDWYNASATFAGTTMYRSGRVWMLACTGGGSGLMNTFSGGSKQIVALGCQFGLGTAGFHSIASGGALNLTSGGTQESKDGAFVGWVTARSGSGASGLLLFNAEIGPRGLALIYTVGETYGSHNTYLHWVNADTNNNAAQNVVVQCCTTVGDRTNWLYNDSIGFNATKRGFYRDTLAWRWNAKTDVFAADGTCIGNWSEVYHVGHRNLCILTGDSQGSLAYGAGRWIGEVRPPNTTNGWQSASMSVNFVNDQSQTGGDAGNGDYRLTATTNVPTVPEGELAYPFDRFGNAVPDDGTALVGAFPLLAV